VARTAHQFGNRNEAGANQTIKKSVHCFDFIYLFAESRLGDVQSVGGPSEVQLFGQDNDGVQVTYFNPGQHFSNSLWQTAEIGNAEAKRGLEKPPIVTQATDDLMAEMDLCTQFLDDRADSTKTPEDFVSQEELVQAVQKWLPGMMGGWW
jgi:hypothetical protein